ncbi:aldolase [Crossiella sp. CA-258035]|uniref:class II aldolase/adducin family protein n=1 Tax=Crossiella sp. CA-258035 TaxID=2981138 RepID=UPI0024BCB7F9|nr:aldolase [Crossiella sp. CA-258035]WHT22843.1 aldolase [Crossiella sp. CA-258035]
MTRQLRDQVVATARTLHARGLTHGRTGNVSIRAGEHLLITPTGASLDSLTPEQLSEIDADGRHVSGPPPSKEAFLHAAVLRQRPHANAVLHTHSTHAAAVSCLAGLDPANAIPPLTAYFTMRIGRLPLLPYHAPGDPALAPLVAEAAREHHALLLANHGPVVCGPDPDTALDALEELEHTAAIMLLTRGLPTTLVPSRTDPP